MFFMVAACPVFEIEIPERDTRHRPVRNHYQSYFHGRNHMTDKLTESITITFHHWNRRCEAGPHPPMDREFHISRKMRNYYGFDEILFGISGNVIFADFFAVRRFARKMNARRDLMIDPRQTVKAGDLNAMGLIDEILHYVFRLYMQQKMPDVHQKALRRIENEIGKKELLHVLRRFADSFPTVDVYRGKISLAAYLKGKTGKISNRSIVLEELIMLWLANINPAFAPFRELFDDSELQQNTAYIRLMETMHDFFNSIPGFGPDDENLLDMLRSPAQHVPHSLKGQLEFIRERWGYLLGDYIFRLLSSLDLILEEEKLYFPGPGPARIPMFADDEPERFSSDMDWMPRVVMIAKNVYVWMDQLSRIYQKSIARLDQIPDEELDTLARRGFNTLWLIGLWERSQASREIKRLCGNPEAEASAYAILEYDIATGLGGHNAFQSLKERAWKRGIRMAGDMVPNHMGIDSRWVYEHPEWFISMDHSPFPAYTFYGVNLSRNNRAGLYLEDHYYNRSDAAVVFKRVDHETGDEKYIYHGNDGTSMPWNDTAQLNFLNPAAREAVIQTILHVARHFPVIRFDAAMTLVKRHIQRLWFPEPGTGGAIPSRAGQGMTKADFDAIMPEEFWREVVDRIQKEAPDTLLLAEAFWMLEGYFVRTLGMHRVYNSAFMNMLKNEENSKYRELMKSTLAFNPEILKRFVNFMNNPDEDTAVSQFGNNDKYFGVCIMMSTMPGLPMFGHGQVEGLTEKYGMEYRRAYLDETPDQALVARHEREIFPLLHRRYLFAHVDHFRLYDFRLYDRSVDENVFAYSNRFGDERALIIYHNSYSQTAGWIRISAPFSASAGPEGNRSVIQQTLGEGLGLANETGRHTIFRDYISGLEYIRSNVELWTQGLYISLDAFKYHVFMDFREVSDSTKTPYGELQAYLNGRGVPSIDAAAREMIYGQVHQVLKQLVNGDILSQYAKTYGLSEKTLPAPFHPENLGPAIRNVLEAVANKAAATGRIPSIQEKTIGTVSAIQSFHTAVPLIANKLQTGAAGVWKSLDRVLGRETLLKKCLFIYALLHDMGRLTRTEETGEESRSMIYEFHMNPLVMHALAESGESEDDTRLAMAEINIALAHQHWFALQNEVGHTPDPQTVIRRFLEDNDVQAYLNLNSYNDTIWFSKERFERLLLWMTILGLLEITASGQPIGFQKNAPVRKLNRLLKTMETARRRSGHRIAVFLEALSAATDIPRKDRQKNE